MSKTLIEAYRKLQHDICCLECNLVQPILISILSDYEFGKCAGFPLTLTASVYYDYGSVTYVWEQSVHYTPNTWVTIGTTNVPTLFIDTSSYTIGNYSIRVTATDKCHSAISNVIEFQINEDPLVYILPDSETHCSGESVTIFSEVLGGSGGNNYQWQQLIDGVWTNVPPSANFDTYVSGALTEGEYTYRLIVTQNAYCETISATTTITVTDCP